MAREDLHFRLRIPEDLKKRIEAHADLNGRSMTAEIVDRLTRSLNDDARLRIANAEIEALKLRIARLEGFANALQQGQDVFTYHLARAAGGEKITYDEIKADLAALPPPGSKAK